ncbi:hypothetical protein VPHD164_0058 [Vibrio phage D164]
MCPLSWHISTHPSAHTHQHIPISTYPSAHLYIRTSIHPHIYISTHLYIHTSIHPCI